MAETAAHLVDHVIPHVPARQFVLSVPKRLRPFLHHRPRTATAVLHILLRALHATLREASPSAPASSSMGAVSFLHRFGSSLNPHFHFHRVVVDGGVVAWFGGECGFPPPPGPSSPDLDAIGPPQADHRVEDLTSERDFDSLAVERSTPHALTQDALVPEHSVLHQAPPAVA